MYTGDITRLFFSQVAAAKSDPQKCPPQQQQQLQRVLPQYQQQAQQLTSYSNDMKAFISRSGRLNDLFAITTERTVRLEKAMGEKSLFLDTTSHINTLTSDIKNELHGIQGIIQALTEEVQKSSYNVPPSGVTRVGNNTNATSNILQIKHIILEDLKTRYSTLSSHFTTLLQTHARSSLQSSRKNIYEHDNTLNQTHQQHLQHYQGQQQQHQQQFNQTPPQNNNNNANTAAFAAPSQPQQFQSQQQQQQQSQPNNNLSHGYQSQQLRQRGGQNPRNNGGMGGRRQRQQQHISFLESELSDDQQSDVENGPNSRQSYQNGPNFEALVDQTLIQPQTVAFENQNDSYYTSRQQSMQQIVETIQDVASMHSRLTDMIHKQEEVVVRIDTNIEEVGMYVDGANEQIMDLYEFSSNNQWLLIKIFAVLIIFAIFFITVIS